MSDAVICGKWKILSRTGLAKELLPSGDSGGWQVSIQPIRFKPEPQGCLPLAIFRPSSEAPTLPAATRVTIADGINDLSYSWAPDYRSVNGNILCGSLERPERGIFDFMICRWPSKGFARIKGAIYLRSKGDGNDPEEGTWEAEEEGGGGGEREPPAEPSETTSVISSLSGNWKTVQRTGLAEDLVPPVLTLEKTGQQQLTVTTDIPYGLTWNADYTSQDGNIVCGTLSTAPGSTLTFMICRWPSSSAPRILGTLYQATPNIGDDPEEGTWEAEEEGGGGGEGDG